MKTRHLVAAAVALIVLVGASVTAGIAIGTNMARAPSSPASPEPSRGFMFQVVGVQTSLQGGHTLNLFLHYRYNRGITDREIPDYRKLRQRALDYLKTADVPTDIYWEVLNHHLCDHLKSNYPLEAISCEMQVAAGENGLQPGAAPYRASVETIGDIEPLAIPGRAA